LVKNEETYQLYGLLNILLSIFKFYSLFLKLRIIMNELKKIEIFEQLKIEIKNHGRNQSSFILSKTEMLIRKFFPSNEQYLDELRDIMLTPVNYRTDFKNEIIPLIDVMISDLRISMDIPSDSSGSLNEQTSNLIKAIYDYILKNPDQYRKKTHSIPIEKRKSVMKRDDFQCRLCGEVFSEQEIEIDHIFPYSLGGSDEEYNLMVTCSSCNKDKGKSLSYYQSDTGKEKIKQNIRIFTDNLNIINNFSSWLKGVADKRRKNL